MSFILNLTISMQKYSQSDWLTRKECFSYFQQRTQTLKIDNCFTTKAAGIQLAALREKCPYSELFWSVYFRIWTEYGQIRSISAGKYECGKIRTRITPNMDTFHAVQDKLVAIESQHNKLTHKKLIANSPLNIVHIFIYKKTIFCISLNFFNIMLEIRLRFS